MILTIINLICLLSIIAVVLYIVLTYNTLKKDIVKMSKIIPEVGSISNKLKDVYVPGGPSPAPPSLFVSGSNEPRLVPMSQTVKLLPTPTSYVPPTEAMKTYYTILKAALDSFEQNKTAIMKLVSSQDFYNSKDEAAKQILRESNFMVPILAWYIYENSVSKSALSQKDVNDMYVAINFLNNPAYMFTSATGENIHFSTLSVSSSLQQFYTNNKLFIDTCLRDKTC